MNPRSRRLVLLSFIVFSLYKVDLGWRVTVGAWGQKRGKEGGGGGTKSERAQGRDEESGGEERE